LATAFEPGDATLMALTIAAEQRWRIISSAITIEDFGPLEQLAVPHTKARFRGDVRAFLTEYAKAGGPHHLAICFGDARRRLGMLADLMDAGYYEVQ
jgi:L-arabinose isomerase